MIPRLAFTLFAVLDGLFGAIAGARHAVGSSDGAFSGCLSGKLEAVAVYLLYDGECHFIKILNAEHYAPHYIIPNRLEVQC